MSEKKLAMVDSAAQAERAAKAQPHVDINSTMTPCPARQPELFVVPVRYALAEESAENPCCVPGVTTQSRPMAARRLRAGFVYLWQDQGPLQRYAVSPDGLLKEQVLEADATAVLDATLAGLALKKNPRCLDALQRVPTEPGTLQVAERQQRQAQCTHASCDLAHRGQRVASHPLPATGKSSPGNGRTHP